MEVPRLGCLKAIGVKQHRSMVAFNPPGRGRCDPKKTFASEEKWCQETQLRGGESVEGCESEVMAIHYPKGWWKVEWFLKLQNIQFDFLMKAENGIICIWNSSKTNFFLIRSKCFYTPPGRDRAEEPSSWIASLCHTKAEWLPWEIWKAEWLPRGALFSSSLLKL